MPDKYQSVSALKRDLGPGAYRIRRLDRGSRITVIAPHGGFIDPGSSAVARAVAGREHNLFDFQGLREDLAADMHVTATRFRDPALTPLLAACEAAVSVHWMGNQGAAMIWLGGRNWRLKVLVLKELTAAGFTVNANGPRYRGESPLNVVNLPRQQGVQLEISEELMCRLFRGKPFHPRLRARTTVQFTRLVKAVRTAIASYS